MPNQVTVEIYIKRCDVESILSDSEVTQLLIQGSVDITSSTTCQWNLEAVGYPTAEKTGRSTCPQPCP